jgi:predicted AlkP superfamily phosphohydrolase/phosphomutase
MRIFIFGIDGLTMRIMGPLMEKGLIPNFKSIYESGNRGILKSTIPPLTPPSWASIYSGKNPGKHGLFEFRKRNGYIFKTNTCWDYDEAPPFWKHLTENGKKCVLINLPLYYPPMRLQNCISISGFPITETFNIYHPESLKQEIMREAPDYKVDSNWQHNLMEGQEKAFIKANIEVTKSRIKALNYLMSNKAWDLFFIVFTGTDRLQHFFWDEIINGGPETIQYYKLLDETIGHVIGSLKQDDFFFIVSDHGFCPIHTGVNLNTVLQQHGFISIKETVEIPVNYMKLKKLADRWKITYSVKKFLPRKLIDRFQRHTKMEGTFAFSKINWLSTKTFASSGLFGGICINLKDRESLGIVSKSEYESLRDEVIQVFSSLEKDGKKIMKGVYKREDIYSGKNVNEMPDVVLLAESGFRFDETIDDGSIFREPRDGKNRHIVVGEHEVESIFMFKHGDVVEKRFNEVSVTDIAPSILNIFGISIPTSMDGKSLFEDYKTPVYLDELTGAVFKKQDRSPSNIKSKLKSLIQ